jgi:hypothetical protein
MARKQELIEMLSLFGKPLPLCFCTCRQKQRFASAVADVAHRGERHAFKGDSNRFCSGRYRSHDGGMGAL